MDQVQFTVDNFNGFSAWNVDFDFIQAQLISSVDAMTEIDFVNLATNDAEHFVENESGPRYKLPGFLVSRGYK